MVRPKILVIGSMNMDLFVQGCNRIPKFGESVLCGGYGFATGGKGSNQAFAAAKLGADAALVGRVGNDDYGKQLLHSLEEAGVDTRGVAVDEEEQTGMALMLLDESGKYISYSSNGANRNVCVEDVKKALDTAKYDMIVMQLEIALETVYQTCELARERGIPVFLDAGPAMKIPLERLKGLYIISPNEVEAEALTGISVETEEGVLLAAKWLYEKTAPRYVIMKLGERGAMLYDGTNAEFIPGFKVNAIDSTAAGDTFGAALSIQLCRGMEIRKAIVYAQAAAAICVSRMGAQTSIPSQEEVEQFLA